MREIWRKTKRHTSVRVLWDFRLFRLCFNVPGFYAVFVRLEQPLTETKLGTWLEEVSEMQENTTLVDAGQILNTVSYTKSLPLILKCPSTKKQPQLLRIRNCSKVKMK